MKIEMVDLRGQYLHIQSEINEAMQEVLASAAFINGSQVKEFSRNLALYNGIKHVVTCGNGTDALQIAFMALGLKPGDEVIVPVHTYVATAEVIALLHFEPPNTRRQTSLWASSDWKMWTTVSSSAVLKMGSDRPMIMLVGAMSRMSRTSARFPW